MDLSKENANESAFARPFSTNEVDGLEFHESSVGLTKREYMATAIMAGLMSDYASIPTYQSDDLRDLARNAVKAADALLDELAK